MLSEGFLVNAFHAESFSRKMLQSLPLKLKLSTRMIFIFGNFASNTISFIICIRRSWWSSRLWREKTGDQLKHTQLSNFPCFPHQITKFLGTLHQPQMALSSWQEFLFINQPLSLDISPSSTHHMVTWTDLSSTPSLCLLAINCDDFRGAKKETWSIDRSRGAIDVACIFFPKSHVCMACPLVPCECVCLPSKPAARRARESNFIPPNESNLLRSNYTRTAWFG